MRCQVKAKRDEACFVLSEMNSVDVNVCDLTHAFELDDDFLSGSRFGQRKLFAVPRRSHPKVRFALVTSGAEVVERVDVVPSVWTADG